MKQKKTMLIMVVVLAVLLALYGRPESLEQSQ